MILVFLVQLIFNSIAAVFDFILWAVSLLTKGLFCLLLQIPNAVKKNIVRNSEKLL